MKNLKLSVKRLHIRFEDDYFSTFTPFSFGLVIEKLDLISSDNDWSFDSPMHLNFFREAP